MIKRKRVVSVPQSVEVDPAIPTVRLEALWCGRKPALQETVAAFYPGAHHDFTPHFNERLLRAAVLEAVPGLIDLRARLLDLLSSQYPAVMLSGIDADADRHEARCRLFALALAFGFPTPSEQKSGRLLWDVQPRPEPIGRQPTYSEHQRVADLHSDSQYFPEPEELGILYAVRAARCGGGQSIFCDVAAVGEALGRTREGREARKLLYEPIYPFPIYDPFFADIDWESGSTRTPVVMRPILADRPRIRFRADVLKAGFGLRRSPTDAAAMQGLAGLQAALASAAKKQFLVPDGCAVLWDNHSSLHGRTAFADPERHLLRVRIARRSVSEQVAGFNVQAFADGAES